MDQEAETLQQLAGALRLDEAQGEALQPPKVEKGRAPSTDDIIAALRTVYDPEIPVNVYDLGLIYRIDQRDQGLVEIDMTLTAPGCPVAGEMLNQVQKAAASVEGIRNVTVNLVFDPPWDKSKMSEEASLELGLI